MEIIKFESIIPVLQYLLPGFITAWVFYGITSYPRPSAFERVILALIFNLAIQLTFYGIKKSFAMNVTLGDEDALLFLIPIALALGWIFSVLACNTALEKIYKKIRSWTVSQSYPSAWQGAFTRNITYVILHFNDGKRLQGWPREWPNNPESGHILVENPAWIDNDNNIVTIKGTSSILVEVRSVRLVEFLNHPKMGVTP